MKQIGLLAAVVVCSTLVLPRLAPAQTTPAIPPSITTPDKVESRLGTLDFKDGAPSPAMSMRLTGIGSQYLFVTLDADKQYFDGAKTYKVTLPKGIPEEKFWSFTVYDNQTRSMLDTPQRYPRAGSQSYPSPAAEPDADGSTTVYFSPTQPTGIKRGNWIQTDPKKGWFAILRLYSPLEPFFTKAWRPSEITLER